MKWVYLFECSQRYLGFLTIRDLVSLLNYANTNQHEIHWDDSPATTRIESRAVPMLWLILMDNQWLALPSLLHCPNYPWGKSWWKTSIEALVFGGVLGQRKAGQWEDQAWEGCWCQDPAIRMYPKPPKWPGLHRGAPICAPSLDGAVPSSPIRLPSDTEE